jgi:Domain of unknown function (DUF222)
MSVVELERSQHSYRASVLEAGGTWHAQHHRLLQRIAELDRSGEWAADGVPSCAHWLTDALQTQLSTAREWVRVARALAALPEVDAAFADGVSYSKIRALTRVATADTQAELIALAKTVSAGRLTHALAAWQLRRETPAETETRQRAQTALWFHDDIHGMAVATVRLPPEEMAKVSGAIERRVRDRRPDASADASDRWPSLARQRGDAFVELWNECCGRPATTTEIVLHVRGDGNTMDDGTPVPDSLIERVAPTSFLRALIHDADGRPINASGRHRHPSSRQRRVVHERDRRCVDCGTTELLDYDHDPPWERSGHTVVDELHLRCVTCHHRRHRTDE